MQNDYQDNYNENTDTVRLLRECDAGIKMGLSSLSDVINDAKHPQFKTLLANGITKHKMLADEMEGMLQNLHDDGKEPNPVAKGMSWMKTNVKMMANFSDQTIADLMTDGCNMGVKSISKFVNEYKRADAKSKDLANRLINVESTLAQDIRKFL